MNHKRLAQRIGSWFWILLFVAYAAFAADVLINTLNPEYRGFSQIDGASVQASGEARIHAASQAAALYRLNSGMPFSALQAGSSFRVIWPDGSSETIVVGDPASSAGARLVEGSQERGVGNER